MTTILLTRPRPASERLAAVLKTYGYDSFIEPLLTITPSCAPMPDVAAQMVMITSGNALAALKASGTSIDRLLDLPCFCVGARTAEEARAFGFRDVRDGGGDGKALAETIGRSVIGGTILHIAGRDIDSDAGDALRAAGRTVAIWPVYSAAPAAALSQAAIDALKGGCLPVLLVFSARTAETLHTLLRRHGLEACCRDMIAIGISAEVVAPLGALPWRQTIAAPQPTEDAVIDCLRNALPVSRTMSDITLPQTPPPAPDSAPEKQSCSKQKYACLFLLLVLAAAAAGAGYYFRPWVMPEANAPDLNPLKAQLADVTARARDLANRVDALEAHTASAVPIAAQPASGDTARMQGDVAALTASVGALQAEVKQVSASAAQSQQTTRGMLAVAIGFIQLRDAAASGHGFGTALTSMHAAASGDTALQEPLAKLEPYAATGAPTYASLREELDGLEAGAANAVERSKAQNWWQRMLAELKSLVSIRPLHGDGSGDFAPLEAALSRDDAAGALAALQSLPLEAQQNLADIHKGLEARQAVDDAIAQLAAKFTNTAAP